MTRQVQNGKGLYRRPFLARVSEGEISPSQSEGSKMILSLCLRHYSSPQLIFRRFSEDTSQASISNAAEFCFFLSYFAKLLMCTIMCNTIIVYRYYYYYYDIVFYVLHLQVCLYIIVSVKHFVTSLLIQYVLNSNSTIQQLGQWP